MKKTRMGLGAIAVVGTAALVLTGCASGGDSGDSASGDSSAIITTNGSEPQNPLIPSNTTETGGGKIIDSVFAGLVSYNAKGATEMDAAESIESDDNKLWTIKLKEGQTFTDGTPVTAESFTKAWNWAAQFSNAQSASYFFDNIAGYSAEADSDLALTVVSDTEFTAELAAPAADWPLRLGYSAFSPLPESFYDDTEAFGENPIGNGPYKLASADAWTHNQDIKLVTNSDYDGPRKPVNGGLTITFYTTQDAAYADVLSGNLDILDQVPDSQFASYQSDFPDRFANQPAAIFQSFTIPQYLEHFDGTTEEGKLRRAAISKAINRDDITKVIFQDTRTPAKDFTSPVIDGYSDDLEGSDVLTYDAEEAKDLWAQAEAIAPYGDTTFTLAYNADGGHQNWVDAATNSIADTLGIKAEGKSYATFAELLDDEDNDAMDGAFRSGWQADYPSLYNFLSPLYQTGAGSNYGRYTSTEFDGLLEQGAAATSADDATADFQKAQEVLFQDLPVVPLWYSNVTGVWADTVDNVEFGWNSVPLFYEVTKS
ncbi:oligopeptide transport system substrate-binding protein [Frigoribacterium sp. PvP120]|uniref:peptide ABC transporter substrate-binding protein n=1 Tax=unclassified Frigoribacterium TaxID=2627005 RepID=UPI001AE2F762|nr:ABC transporter substrate-binding protein [Frigoribacterium sp. PvP121]MBP1242511.1 oligopeptide transport system substrate-binding protein [Frigoribacterium sp. PvP121]